MENSIKFLTLKKISFRCILPFISLFLFILSVDICSARDQKLASSFRKPVVIFRLDDIVFEEKGLEFLRYNQNTQNDLIKEFIIRNIPITLSVIPFWKDKEMHVNNSIIRLFGKEIQLGSIEIAQHGFRHLPSRNEQTEFRYAPYTSQIQWIQKGKEILQRTFPSKITTFIPPWNNYDSITIRTLIELRFNCLSGDLGPVGQADENLIHVSNNPITYIPASCSFREVKHAVELALSPQYQSKKFRSFIVVCFHPYDFKSSARNPITKIELGSTLDELKKMPVEFATLSAVADRYSKELNLSRQVQAARMDNLGKVLKLIPGLGVLLPADYNFGRWIPFGVYLSEEVYSSIEKQMVFKISGFFLFFGVLFVEALHLFFKKKTHIWNIAIWILLSSIFSLSIMSYFILLPERKSLALAAIISLGLCLFYWVIRNLLVYYLVLKSRKLRTPSETI